MNCNGIPCEVGEIAARHEPSPAPPVQNSVQNNRKVSVNAEAVIVQTPRSIKSGNSK